eukprot:10139261-Heterocapsa_arctica.AAC.1
MRVLRAMAGTTMVMVGRLRRPKRWDRIRDGPRGVEKRLARDGRHAEHGRSPVHRGSMLV